MNTLLITLFVALSLYSSSTRAQTGAETIAKGTNTAGTQTAGTQTGGTQTEENVTNQQENKTTSEDPKQLPRLPGTPKGNQTNFPNTFPNSQVPPNQRPNAFPNTQVPPNQRGNQNTFQNPGYQSPPYPYQHQGYPNANPGYQWPPGTWGNQYQPSRYPGNNQNGNQNGRGPGYQWPNQFNQPYPNQGQNYPTENGQNPGATFPDNRFQGGGNLGNRGFSGFPYYPPYFFPYGNLTCYSCRLDFLQNPYKEDDPCLGRHHGLNVSVNVLDRCGINDTYCRTERTEKNGIVVFMRRDCSEKCRPGCKFQPGNSKIEACVSCCKTDACNHEYPVYIPPAIATINTPSIIGVFVSIYWTIGVIQ